jgi:hypothetical protein
LSVAEKEDKPIRVVDRRMFTSDGELRPDFEPEESPSTPPPPPPSRPAQAQQTQQRPAAPPRPAAEAPATSAAPKPSGSGATGVAAATAEDPGEAEGEDTGEPGPEAGEPTGEFSAIVRSLATTAYSALGLLPDPSGTRHRDPAIARQMIDWLGVLESKTRNNLSFEESDFLARVLYELRLAFVEVTRPARR